MPSGEKTLERRSAAICASPGVWIASGGNESRANLKANSCATIAMIGPFGIIFIMRVRAVTLSPFYLELDALLGPFTVP